MDGDLHGVEAELELRRLRVNLGQVQSNFDALFQIHTQLEAREKALVQAIRGIAETLIPERLAEMAREDSQGFQRLGAMELARLVQVEAASKMYRLGVARGDPGGARLAELEAALRDRTDAVEALRAKVALLEADLAEAEKRARVAEERVAMAVERTASAPRAPAPVEGEDRTTALLRILATTGVSRRKEIEGILREEHGVPDGGSMQRLFDRAMEAGWIVRSRPKAEVRGRNTELVRLTEAGREQVQRELGMEPVVSEWERLGARHGSDAHVLLTLEGADHLRRFGATAVDVAPPYTQTPEGGTFAPDIVAVLEGRPVYVECERYTRKDRVARNRKWANYHQVTGEFCVICPDESAYKAIVAEVTAWAMESGKGVRLKVARLDQADRLWTLEREIPSRENERRGLWG